MSLSSNEMTTSSTASSDWDQPNRSFEVFDQDTLLNPSVGGETPRAIPQLDHSENPTDSTPRLSSFSDKPITSEVNTTTSGTETPGEIISNGNSDQQSQIVESESHSGSNQDDAAYQAKKEAAKAKVLETITTSDSVGVTPKPRGGARTASRRSRGGTTRTPRIKAEPGLADDSPSLSSLPPAGRTVNKGGRPRGSRAGASAARGRNRGGRPRGSRAGISAATSTRGIKRKRKKKSSDDEEEDDANSSGSEAMILPQLSSSGRRISQAKSFTNAAIDLEAPPTTSATKKARFAVSASDAAPATYIPPALKRKHARNPAEAAVCRSCGRGHSPQNNQIVFCDVCETPWHQYCHDRPISPTVVRVEESEWRCSDCNIGESLAKFGKGRLSQETFAKSTGINPTLQWTQDYLMSVSKETLVNLLLKAQDGQEDLPLFEPAARLDLTVKSVLPDLEKKAEQLSQPPPKAKVVPATTRREAAEDAEGEETAEVVVDEDEGYSEEPLPYPKMGNGLVLPPESEDVDILVDENEAVYSHSWQDGPDNWKGPFAAEDVDIRGVCQWCHDGDVRVGFRSRFCLRCRQEMALSSQNNLMVSQTTAGSPLTNGYSSNGDIRVY